MTEESHQDENQEGLIFSKITRYIAEQMGEEIHDENTEEENMALRQAIDLYIEIADAFEQAGGFEYEADQALNLSQAMGLLVTAMKSLSDQAHGQNQSNAAAKMEWAALQANNMTAKLQECYLAGSAGFISIGNEY